MSRLYELNGTAGPRIRPMRLEDLPQVLGIERASFPTPWSEGAFRGELTANKYARYFVAEKANYLTGYAGVWIIINEAHVTNIAVHPFYRRRGIGRMLLETLMTRAAQEGCQAITLEVRKSNFSAQNLYRQYGFEPVGIRRGYYIDTNEDAIIMTRFGLQSFLGRDG